MLSEPRHWMVFNQLVVPVQCCAEARDQLGNYHPVSWLVGHQRHIMFPCLKSFAADGVATIVIETALGCWSIFLSFPDWKVCLKEAVSIIE